MERKLETPYKELYNAIHKHSSLEDSDIQQAGENGADAGWGGFTYYEDTVTFYKKNRKHILALAREMSDQLGVDTVGMIRDFKCLGRKDYTEEEVSRTLYDPKYKGDAFRMVANALAWFALEEVGRALVD